MKVFLATIKSMRIRKLTAILIFILILQSPSVFSQSVRDISTKDGLPQSFVSGLVQDDTSFIWIGTRNGIARYDGIQFKVLQHNPRDSSTIASNLIIWMEKDKSNKLWIEYESGEIDAMNPVTEKITHVLKGNLPTGNGVQFMRRGWMVDHDGVFWGLMKGTGLNSYDSRDKKVQRFNRQNAGFLSDTLLGVAEIENKGIYILGNQGISLYDKSTKKFTHWKIPYQQDFGDFPGSDAIAVDLHERKNGELMWGDRRNIYFFHPSTHIFRSKALPNIAYLGIRWIRTSLDGYEYFENYGKVYRYNDADGVSTIGKTITDNFGDVKSFLVDRSGLIWLGTNAGGIHQIDLETPFFQSFNYKGTPNFVAEMFQEEWGLNMQTMFDWKVADQVFSPPSYHFRSAYDKNHRLYIALKETVYYYDSVNKKFIKLPYVPVIPAYEKLRIGIRGITVGRNGQPVIVGFNGNLMVYDSTSKKWNAFLDTGLLRKKFGPALNPEDLLTDDSYLWMTTEKDGLIKINIATKEIIQIRENQTAGSLPTSQLLGLKADPLDDNIIWIGSYQGLIRLNKKTLKCELFSMHEGLPDNTVYSILPEPSGNLWLSTNKGICQLNPVTHKVRAFHTQHGLPGDEFNRFHALAFPDGRLTFGGTDGWTIFNPHLMKNDVFETSLAFTDLKINNKEVSQFKNTPAIRLPLNALSQLTLPYEQNTLSFGFAGLEFSQPQDLQYRYRLEGYDNDWVMAGNTRQANYTKVPPGNYTLIVNSSNTSGKWSTHVRTFKLRIEPPWYSTRMAYLCYCIILIGLTWTFIRFRISREIMKQDIVLKEKESLQLKELDDMKSRFFSNITHEFRTPLTLIMGPAEQLKLANAKDPQQRRLTDTIVNNAKQLLILINRLMDLSKLEAKALKLYEQRGNPADAVGTVVHSFESDAATKEIQLSFEDETGVMDCWFYADAIERIVYNLISNALKFTGTGGRVSVKLSANNEKLHLVVRDNGIGIDENKLPHIFDRFYQAGGNGRLSNETWEGGTGIGLSLVKELINQMEGDINVESRIATPDNPLSGTVFTMHLPYRISSEETLKAGVKDGLLISPENLSGNGEAETQSIPQILLVEDSLELAGFIQGILSENYQVTHCVNGALGLESALSLMPDLVLSDVMMPVMDGYTLCDHLKTDIRTSHIPVILLTAKVSKENLIEGLSKGADDYLTKPFHPTELLLRIHNLLDRQQKIRDRVRKELGEPSGVIAEAEPPPQDIFITRLYEVLEEHLDEELFGVDQLVDAVHMSRSSLHRKLKALTGLSTTEVVRNYRLKKATLFLKEGYSSSDAAYKTGFGSPAYFTKSFREVCGVTPGDFVKEFRGKREA